ncbi:hypothetical protein [Streptomyces flavidovirens]|uniref:hypothetical protein n=1 Tax=Streptomyces flavidovirens TaxID=67298 RepID=UPI0036C727C2
MTPIPIIRAEDLEEQALAQVDADLHDYYGPERYWKPWQIETYLDAIAKVHQQFAPGYEAAA